MKKFKRVVLYLDAEEHKKVRRYLASLGITCSEWVRKKFKRMAVFVEMRKKL